MARVVINDRMLASFAKQAKTWPRGKRKTLHDAVVPGGAARVYAGGSVSLGMIDRFPLHPKNPTFRKIGNYSGPGSLAPWRDTVRRWHELNGRWVDPKIEQARQRAAALRAQHGTFEAVWSAFWDRHASKLAKVDEVQRAGAAFRRWFGIRPAAEIEPAEIATHIRRVAEKTPAEARNRLGHLRRMYSWAIGAGDFGLTVNPCASLKPADLIGKKVHRDRILTDDEIRAVWAACAELGYPYGPLVRFMLLTGQREMECAGMVWSEIDQALWVIPAPRMKSDRSHVVPLAPDALALLGSLPRWTGPCVFTTTGGSKPVNGFAKVKRRLDELSGVRSWVLHDVRRTMRTHLSALPVQDMVRELVIAHAKPGLHKVYDLHAYLDEKRECLELWEQRLRRILAPPGVADLDAERVRRVA